MSQQLEIEGWIALVCVYVACYAATVLVPVSRLTPGYCIDHLTGKQQLYRLNGFTSLCIMTTAFIFLVAYGGLPGDFFHTHYWPCLRASVCLGALLSFLYYLRGRNLLKRNMIDRRPRCPTADSPEGGPKEDTKEFDARSSLEHWYCGLSEYNPRGIGGVDLKMFLYLVGAVQLQFNLLSATYAATNGSIATLLASPGIAVVACCLTFFIFEYCFNEHVHTYTYDIFRERLGFKLLWGCTCFYPFFYAIGVFPFTQSECSIKAAQLSTFSTIFCVALFVFGWLLTRGANLQKHACKIGKSSFAFGLIPMHTLPGSRGRILVSGFWGVSRHVNYAGEIFQAVALVLPAFFACGSLLPLAYPAYYLALFIPRAIDDDKQCRIKYGESLWTAYTTRVPYIIVPGVWLK